MSFLRARIVLTTNLRTPFRNISKNAYKHQKLQLKKTFPSKSRPIHPAESSSRVPQEIFKSDQKDIKVTTNVVENPMKGVVFDLQFDTPPVLFIRKYGEIIDTKDVVFHEKEDRRNVTLQTLTNKKIKYILDAVDNTKTLENLKETLNNPPSSSTEHGKSAKRSVFADSDVENVAVADKAVKLTPDTTVDWYSTRLDVTKLPNHYLMLSKSRLTLLVCVTAAAGYGIAPGPFSLAGLILTTLGTGAFSAAANTINQIIEVPFDSQMSRTKNRVLVRGQLSTLHAACFAAVMAVSGTAVLATLVNPLAAGLGLLNLVLYTAVYTPLKRVSIVNTWVGSVVGAVPPLIGWAGCAGSLDAGAAVLAGILYTWQFPHFNSLSWNLRPDYSKAGYRMMSVTHPDLCRRVALRHSVATIAVCTAAPLLDVTTWAFAADSLPLNLYLTYLAWRFYRQGDSNTSRKLFRFSLVHLPLLVMLMCISKKRGKEKSD